MNVDNPNPVDNLNPNAIDAMDALFLFCKAMDKGVTTNDLTDVMMLAIEDGWDVMLIDLCMATSAMTLARRKVRPASPS